MQLLLSSSYLSDRLCPQLSKKFNEIRESFYVQSPQREKMVSACKGLLEWMKTIEFQQNTFMRDIVDSIKAIIPETPAPALIENLKLIEEGIRAQKAWYLRLRQEVNSPLLFQIGRLGENSLEETENADEDRLYDPDEKRRQKEN